MGSKHLFVLSLLRCTGRSPAPGALELRKLVRPSAGLDWVTRAFVEPGQALDCFPERWLAGAWNARVALAHPFVAGEQQWFGLGVFHLSREGGSQQAAGVEGAPVIGQLPFTQALVIPRRNVVTDYAPLIDEIRDRCGEHRVTA